MITKAQIEGFYKKLDELLKPMLGTPYVSLQYHDEVVASANREVVRLKADVTALQQHLDASRAILKGRTDVMNGLAAECKDLRKERDEAVKLNYAHREAEEGWLERFKIVAQLLGMSGTGNADSVIACLDLKIAECNSLKAELSKVRDDWNKDHQEMARKLNSRSGWVRKETHDAIVASKVEEASRWKHEAESWRQCREAEVKNLSTPICVGPQLIAILAKEGQWTSSEGHGTLIAADGLFGKDPYDEVVRVAKVIADNNATIKRLKEKLEVTGAVMQERCAYGEFVHNIARIVGWNDYMEISLNDVVQLTADLRDERNALKTKLSNILATIATLR